MSSRLKWKDAEGAEGAQDEVREALVRAAEPFLGKAVDVESEADVVLWAIVKNRELLAAIGSYWLLLAAIGC